MELKYSETGISRSEIENTQYSTIRFSDWTVTDCMDSSFKIYLDNDDVSLTPSISTHGFWESWITSWHTRNVEPGSIYLDFGANVGYYSLLAAKLGAKKVYAIEPVSRTGEILEESLLEYSHGNPEVTFSLVRKAFGSKNEFRRLEVVENNLGGITLGDIYEPTDEDNWGIKDPNVVGVLRLDDYMKHHRVEEGKHVWKLDVEGAEEDILIGGAESLKKYRPVLVLEWTPNAYSNEFYKTLEEYGQVRLLNYEGQEQLVDEAWLNSQQDWQTIVVRPHE